MSAIKVKRFFLKKAFIVIELVIVIVILGILAAFIVPQFVSLSGHAREKALAGLEGTLHSAATLTHALYELHYQSARTPNVAMVDGQAVGMSNGYPAAVDGISYAIRYDEDKFQLTEINDTTIQFKLDNAPDSDTCYVQYVESSQSNALPAITTVTSGCSW